MPLPQFTIHPSTTLTKLRNLSGDFPKSGECGKHTADLCHDQRTGAPVKCPFKCVCVRVIANSNISSPAFPSACFHQKVISRATSGFYQSFQIRHESRLHPHRYPGSTKNDSIPQFHIGNQRGISLRNISHENGFRASTLQGRGHEQEFPYYESNP